MQRSQGLTLIEVVVVLVVIVVLIAVLLPATTHHHRSPRSMQSSTQVRGIHQGLILFSQGNNGYYAGLTKEGELADALTPSPETPYTAARSLPSLSFALLLNGNYFVPEYLINPAETNNAIAALSAPGKVTSMNYSYAVLRAVDPEADKGRIAEWRDNTNPQAPIVCDRVLKRGAEPGLTETVPPDLQRSTWTTKDGDWRGSVVFGDNSTMFLTTSTVEKTKFDETENVKDNLFTTDGPADARMIRD